MEVEGNLLSKLSYDDCGRGPAVVLIHGFPLCRQMWQGQIRALQNGGFRIIAPDLPGFGASVPLLGKGSMSEYADAIMAMLDDLQIDKVAIGGMSMGGYILFDLMERYPQRLQAAMFLVTRASADDATGRERRSELASAVREGNLEIVPNNFEQVLFAPSTLRRQPELVGMVRSWMHAASPEGVIGALLAMRDRKDYVNLLPGFHLPALVVGAAQDLAIPPVHAELLASMLPAAELHVIPDAGHMANLEQPEEFNRVLLGFLRSLGQY